MTDKKNVEIGSTKRKAKDAFVPDSLISYLMGALRDNFEHLSDHIQHDCAFVKAKSNSKQYTKQLLEELFRYLYLLADSSSDGVIRSSPSYFVDQAFHCLMLDPVLYWKICNELLNMLGKDKSSLEIRVLPHDALGGTGDDKGPRKIRYTNTLIHYKEMFGEDPPLALWSDYSNDPVAVQAELSAQQAQAVSVHRPHLAAAVAPMSAVVAPFASSTTPPKEETNLNSSIKLNFCGNNKASHVTMVRLNEKFEAVFGRVCWLQHQSVKEVDFKCRGMVLRNYMTPYNVNMKDGDVITCNFPILAASTSNTDNLSQGASGLNKANSFNPHATSATAALTSIPAATGGATGNSSNRVTGSDTQLPVRASVTSAVGHNANAKAATASSTSGFSTPCEGITISLRAQSNEMMYFKLNTTTPMRKVFNAFAARKGVHVGKLRFSLDGCCVLPEDTARTLEMEDGDQIDVRLEQSGC